MCMTFHITFFTVKIHMYSFQILVPLFSLWLIICLTLQKLHVFVIKSMYFTLGGFFGYYKLKKRYEIVISKHHDYTNKIAAEVCGKIAVSSRKRAHGMQGIFIVPSWNSLTFARTLKMNLKKEGCSYGHSLHFSCYLQSDLFFPLNDVMKTCYVKHSSDCNGKILFSQSDHI